MKRPHMAGAIAVRDATRALPIRIRRARLADEPAAAAVSAHAFASVRGVYQPMTASPPTVTASGERLVRWVAQREGEVLGTVRCRFEPHRLHLIGLAVHPSFQRRGVARAIVEHLGRVAGRRGLPRLSLYTIRQTGNAIVFERLGFQIVSETPAEGAISPIGEELTELYMERRVFT